MLIYAFLFYFILLGLVPVKDYIKYKIVGCDAGASKSGLAYAIHR